MWWASGVATATPLRLPASLGPFRCRAEPPPQADRAQRKKVVVVGSGWAGLASAQHLCKQGFSATVIDTGSCPAEEVGTNGFWYPYRNIFSLVDELGIQPFTTWTRSGHYSLEGMEFELPVFRDQPRLPAPFGALLYPQFPRLPLVDRLTAIPLIVPVIDFDNTDTAWRKYDEMTARELFKQSGCSARLYREVFSPILQVGLSTTAEQCSAAATLGMLYYYVLAHQQNFDVSWCRGTVQETIFKPWMESMKLEGCNFCENQKITDFVVNEDTGCISAVVCGEDSYDVDAVVLAVGISTLQSIVMSSTALQRKQEFLNVLNLSANDTVSVKLWMDRKVNIPRASNICGGFEDFTAWTFFDLNAIYDEYMDEPSTVIKADLYHAHQLLPLKDEQIVTKVISSLSNCLKEFEAAKVVQQVVVKYPKSASHYFPGSYKYMMRGATTFPNLFMAGDWVVTRHGSWSQEKAYVTGLESANRVIDYFGEGNFAKIIAVEEDEPHIEALRSINRRINETRTQLPFSEFFL
uniref:Phytoene dehydrogenase n=1 Tax=Anthurium amnicola TaxID=1678845 RepID=A0A1D1XV48_9ARAE